MRRSVIAVTVGLVGMLVAAPMATAVQSTGDAKKACADIVEGRVNYQSLPVDGNPTSAEVLAQMDLGANACKNIRYTLTVFGGSTEVDVVGTASGVPVAATATTPPRVEFQTPVSFTSLSDVVCVVITTTKSNGEILDRAPDSGCVALPINSSIAGATRFR
ncbi:MAG: hypothetical protein LH645_03650 [Actinomycetia bacterium]|nr:hypothetical protein [Actinomycetes bacterium]